MEIEETVPILCMCRLCLHYTEDYNETNKDIRDKIKKYLYIEVSNFKQ